MLGWVMAPGAYLLVQSGREGPEIGEVNPKP